MSWNDLGAPDIEAAKSVYPALFGGMTATLSYRGCNCQAWVLDGKVIGGLVHLDRERSRELPVHRLVSFGVDVLHATTIKAVRLGGRTCATAASMAPGRSTVIEARNGACSPIIALSDIPRHSRSTAMNSSDLVVVQRRVFRGSIEVVPPW
jgi:predicted enzyme related to lactoylglutathione lyase